jgi:hypothetical protein
VDLYELDIRLEGIVDLRLSPIREMLTADCFALAKPPSRTDRNYAASQYLGYGIWSAGFNGIIWNSERYAGTDVCILRLSSRSQLGRPKMISSRLLVKEWLREHP